jgi:hypothetical protein
MKNNVEVWVHNQLHFVIQTDTERSSILVNVPDRLYLIDDKNV